jgi:uncharacterized membrane protein YecN with MAPEG domain
MEMPNINLLSITPIYLALLGIIFLPVTMRVGLYRVKNKILIGDGADPELLRRIRGQGNFIETVPLAILLLIVMETLGASSTWLHALGALLVIGRIMHYLAMTEIGPAVFRPIGMVATFATYLVAPVWILVDLL